MGLSTVCQSSRPRMTPPQLDLSHIITLSFYCIMPFKLWHGDYVEDTDPWCPVCFNLSYENIRSGRQPQGRTVNKASPQQHSKGLLRAFHLWWRAQYDFKHRAEQYECVFCAVLLQIIDHFWRQPKPRRSSRQTLSFELTVFENGSVELEDWNGALSHRPTRLILFTPSGIKPLPS